MTAPRPRRRLPRWVALLLVVALPAAYAGCVQMPDSGPIVSGHSESAADASMPSDIDPQPPQQGASRLDVVNGFLQAMTAWPVKTTVAKEYLTSDAAREWNPNGGTIVYDSSAPPSDDAGQVTVRLGGASRLDSTGAWRGPAPAGDHTLRFRVVREHGEYRIANPMDSMVVPSTWFQQRFGEIALYYFDPEAKYLVPEPVFVPQGDQLPTALVTALIAGPPRGLGGVVRTFVPPGLSVGLSVPVSAKGIAEVSLDGQQAQPSAEEAQLLLAQVATTLRQDPAITGFRVTLDERPVRARNGDSTLPIDFGSQFTASGAATGNLFGIDRGRLVEGDPANLTPVPGPFGTPGRDLDSVAVEPAGDRAVGVTDGGRTAVQAPLSTGGPAVRTLLTGATSLARPTADLAGRIWLLDRRSGGARIYCVQDGRADVVRVPGVSGADVRRLVVSRDGTRLVAVVHRASGDEVRGARVATAPSGRVARVVHPFRVPVGAGQRIVDIGWASPTRLAILMPNRPGGLFQIEIVPADGSTVGADTLSTVIGGHVLGLAASPDPDQPTYAVLKNTLVDVRTRVSTQLAGSPTHVGYAG